MTLDDLQPWALTAFEAAYKNRRERDSDGSKRQSREDFAEGFVAALVWARAWSSFKTGVKVG